MKNSEIIEISNKMSPEIKFSIDSVRLLAPKLLNYYYQDNMIEISDLGDLDFKNVVTNKKNKVKEFLNDKTFFYFLRKYYWSVLSFNIFSIAFTASLGLTVGGMRIDNWSVV